MIMSVAFDRSASSSMEKEPRNPMLTNFNVDPCNRTSLWFLLNKFPFFACIYSKVCADIVLISDMWDKDSQISHLKSFSSTLKTPPFCSSSLFFGSWTHISLFWWNFKTWSLKDRKNLSNLEVFMKVCCNNFMIKSLLVAERTVNKIRTRRLISLPVQTDYPLRHKTVERHNSPLLGLWHLIKFCPFLLLFK